MKTGVSRRVVVGGVACGATIQALSALAETRTLNGTVVYRERIALPPTAVVTIRLVDVSMADKAPRTIAQTIATAGSQVPIAYQLHYEAGEVVPGRRYALQADITDNGRLGFTTMAHHAVFTGGADDTRILVQRAAGKADAAPVGRWLAEDIRGGGVIDRLQSVLEIGADGTVSGTGGCNRMSGKAAIAGDRISFGPLASTNMACAPAAMDQEAKFFAVLGDARGWRIDPARHKLALLDNAGAVIATLARM